MKFIRIIISILTSCAALSVLPLYGGEPSVKALSALSFDFTQTKTSAMLAEKAVATGALTYTAPDKVRWEYFTPTQTVFDSSAAGRNRSYKNFSSLVGSLACGGALKSDSNFEVTYEESDGKWLVTLKPARKDLRQMFSQIRLTVNKNDSLVHIIEISEKNGELTVIECHNIKYTELTPIK